MPRIPVQEYQRQPVSTNIGGEARANAPDMPNYEGDSMRRLAGALEQVGTVEGDYAAKFKRDQREADARQGDVTLMTRLDDLVFDPQGGFTTKLGRDAVDGYEDVKKSATDAYNEVRASLKDDNTRRIFDGSALSNLRNMLTTASRHAATQNKVWQVGAVDSRIAVYQQNAANNFNDDAHFEQSLQTIRQEVQSKGALMGWAPEQTAAQAMEQTGRTWARRIESAALYDPLYAQKLYDEHSALVPAAEQVQLERKLKSAVQPVLVKKAADEIMAPSDMQQLERNGYVNASLTDGTAPAPGQGPTTTRDTKAMLAVWLQQADQRAAKDFPDDPVAKDMLVAAIKGRVSTITQMQEGVQRQAQGSLINYIIEKKPGSIDQVLADPDMRANWNAIDPQSKVGIIALAKRDSDGDKIKTNPAVFRDVYARIHADDSDPNKITSDTQLVPFMGKGLSYDDLNHLRNEMKFANSPEGSVFQKDVQTARNAAHRMLRGSIMGQVQPDVAEDAAYRFSKDLDAKIDQARKDGKDPRDLLIPGKPDYVLDPKRVATFMPGAVDAMRAEAAKAKPAGPNAASGTIQQAPTVNDEATYNALPKGAKYVDGRDGTLKEKR
jgi:hypothetical protein